MLTQGMPQSHTRKRFIGVVVVVCKKLPLSRDRKRAGCEHVGFITGTAHVHRNCRVMGLMTAPPRGSAARGGRTGEV